MFREAATQMSNLETLDLTIVNLTLGEVSNILLGTLTYASYAEHIS